MRLFIFLILPLLSLLQARTFTNLQGKSIDGKILAVNGEKVEILLTKNQKAYWIPLKSLSQADQDYIRSWEKEKKAENEGSKKDPSYKPSFRDSAEKLKNAYQLEDNFEADWPGTVSIDLDIEISELTGEDESGAFIYHSPNYEFVCDVALSKNVVRKFAALFEATREFCKQLPISNIKARVPDGAFRYKIRLFETKSAYHQAGGPEGSAGVFMGGSQEILVPLTSLGVKKVGSSYMYDYKKQNRTLPHEIVHQLTDNEYYAPGSVGWFTEGLAEYVAVTSYRSGKFMVRSNRKEIVDFVTHFGRDNWGRNLGKDIRVGDLKRYFLQPYGQFTANGNHNYGVGLLFTYYFFHFDNKGDRVAITNFLKALKSGKRGEAALEALLNGRSYEELEEDIRKAWKSRGVKFEF